MGRKHTKRNGYNHIKNRDDPKGVSNFLNRGGKTKKTKGGDITGNTPPAVQTQTAAPTDTSADKKKQDCKSSCQKTFDTCNQKCDNPSSWFNPFSWKLTGGKSRRSYKKCGGKKTKKSRTLAKK